MGIEPGACTVVEDSSAGVEAGMRLIGFTGGSHCRPRHAARLAERGPSQIIDDPNHRPHGAAVAAAEHLIAVVALAGAGGDTPGLTPVADLPCELS